MNEGMIQTEKEALAFIKRHGLVTLFPVKGTRFPNLYDSTAGKDKDEKFEKAWTWADNLAQKKVIYYCKLVAKQVTLVSLETFPYIFKLHHSRLGLNPTARKILDFLTQHGAASTTKLRRQLRLVGKERKAEFTKALEQLQQKLTITVVDREKSPRMTYTWDLVERWMPKELLAEASKTSETLAKDRIIAKLLENQVIFRTEEADELLRWF